MKTIYKYILLLLTPFVAGGVITSCTDDDSGGEPFVSYVRITDPGASDSLLVAAGQGQMVAIMGRNLDQVRELWFNNQQAVLTPTFITSTSVITSVPSQIPTVITNKMKLVFANGDSLIHDFTTDISEPRMDRMKSEYVEPGKEAIFYGDFFYEPLSVVFPGGGEAELVSVEDQEVHVKVPAGSTPGPVVMTSNFGVSQSDFWYNDDRNIVASFDATTNGMWHGPAYIVSSDPVIEPVDGKFIRMKSNLAAWGWFELWVGPSNSDAALELKNIPKDAFDNPSGYNLKFEINTLKSLAGANIRMYIGPDMPGQRGDTYYTWLPNLNSEGVWETVSIPWADVYAANNSKKMFVYNPDGYGVSIHFSGPNPVTGDFALDNMRVVPNTSE